MKKRLSFPLLCVALIACTSCSTAKALDTPPAQADVPNNTSAPPDGGADQAGQYQAPADSPSPQDSSIPSPDAQAPTALGNSPAPSGSASPATSGTSANPAPLAASPASGAANPAPFPSAAPPAAVPPIPITYAVGKQWVYNYTFDGTNATATIEIDITALDGNNVTWKVVRSAPGGQSSSQTVTYPKDGLSPFSFVGVSSATPGEKVTTATESVTVPAGAFTATKTTVTDVYDTPTAHITNTIVRWIDPKVGLIKQVTTTTAGASAAASDATTSTVTLSLQSYK